MERYQYYIGSVFILCSGYVHAVSERQFVATDTFFATQFFSQSHLDFSTRNYWKYLKENESQPKEVHNAWGQAFNLNYQSGYLFDVIGFDVDYTGVIKLGASDYFSTRALLFNDGAEYDKKNARGFNKIGQRYVKVRLGDDVSGLQAKAGWQVLKNYGVLTASHRLSQNSYSGYSASLQHNNINVDMARVTSSINRDSSHKVSFLTNDKRPITSISTAGVTYKNDAASFSWAWGEAKDYMTRHIIEMTYKPVDKLILGSQVYGSHGLQKYHGMAAGKKDFDNNAWHYATDIKWQEPDWSLKFGLAYTQAGKENAVGHYGRHLTKNMRGRFNALASAGVDYMRDGELALAAVGEYRVFDDLITGLQINYGQFHFAGNTIRTGEVSLFNRWAPASGMLKNLSVFTMAGYGWSYKNINVTPMLNSHHHYQHSPNLSGEVIIEYKFNLF